MDRGNIAPAPVSMTMYNPNDLQTISNSNIYLLNTYHTFGKKKSYIASNAFDLTSRENLGQDMFMLLPPEMRNNVQTFLPNINENR